MVSGVLGNLAQRTRAYSPHLIALSLLTGVIGGLGAIVFRWLIGVVQAFVAWVVPGRSVSPSHLLIALAPAAGIVAVNLISHYLAREVKGHGVPQILEALALHGGRIRPRVSFFGILAPAITIGSGGSVGREGPIALIGAAFGSLLGQSLRLSERDISLLLACGAAAGIGATFNAPIAGGFFGLEVILGTYAMGALVPVFLSSVMGVSVFNAFMGSRAVLVTPPYHVINHFAVLFMLTLGVVMAFVAWLYTSGLTFSEDLFARLPLQFWQKGLLGGLLVGLLGLILPQVLGVGYPVMHAALLGSLGLGLLLVLFAAKLVATLLTIGAGGSGGVFAPSLFIGGMAGGAFGALLHAISPSLAPFPEIYAVAGMAAMFAAAAQAPFVAITILLEITGDYRLTAPVMAAAAISYGLYRLFTPYSMYTVRLSRRGIVILRGQDVRPTDQVTVRSQVDRMQQRRISASMPSSDAYEFLTASDRPFALVTDDDGTVLGLLTLVELVHALDAPGSAERPVREFLPPMPRPIEADASLDAALRQLGQYDMDALPVTDQGRVIGVISRGAVLRGYRQATLRTLTISRQIQELTEDAADPGQFFDIYLRPSSAVVGTSIVDLGLPQSALVVAIRRQGKAVIPHGGTVLEAGDRVVVFAAASGDVEGLRRRFES